MRRAAPRIFAVGAALVLGATGCGGEKKAAPAPPFQHFRTRPDLKPPQVEVATPAHGTAGGLVFIAPKTKVAQAGPTILDDDGELVWFHPLDTHGVADFRGQLYHGRPASTRSSSRRRTRP